MKIDCFHHFSWIQEEKLEATREKNTRFVLQSWLFLGRSLSVRPLRSVRLDGFLRDRLLTGSAGSSLVIRRHLNGRFAIIGR